VLLEVKTKKLTLRQVITASNLELKRTSKELTNKETNAQKKKSRKKGKLLGRGHFVDTRFVTGTGELRAWFDAQSKSSLTAQETLSAERDKVKVTLEEWEKMIKKQPKEGEEERRTAKLQSRFDRRVAREEKKGKRDKGNDDDVDEEGDNFDNDDNIDEEKNKE
jgi:hypothetical protein